MFVYNELNGRQVQYKYYLQRHWEGVQFKNRSKDGI